MNKISSAIKDLLPLFMLTTVIVLIFTQIPVKAIQILIILNFGISLCLFLTKFLNKTRLSFHFPKLVLYFCLSFLAIPTLEGQIPLVLIIGQWICRENFICGFFTSLMLCASLLLYCKMHVNRTQEIAARFCLDKMSLETFDIDQQIASGHLVLFAAPLFIASLGFKTDIKRFGI